MKPVKSKSTYLPPTLAGVGLGITLYATYMLSGHGLGAYGFFRDLLAALSHALAPFWTADNGYLSNFVHAEGPFSSWIAWEIAGVALGGLIGSLLARRFRLQVERGVGMAVTSRLLFAVLGGILSGFGGAMARGCTSGLGLSGAALLSSGAFVFLVAFFLGGILASLWARRLWR